MLSLSPAAGTPISSLGLPWTASWTAYLYTDIPVTVDFGLSQMSIDFDISQMSIDFEIER